MRAPAPDLPRLRRLLSELDALGAPPAPGVTGFTWQGQEHDQHVVFGMMIHGDEVGSLPAGLDLARALRSGARRFGGRVSLIVGNPEAGLVDRRFLQADLNRVFLDLPPEHPAFGTHEHRRAAALAPVLDAADLFLDLHQTIEPTSSPFAIFPWTPLSEAWVRALQPAPAWVTRPPDSGFSPGTRCADEAVRDRGKPGITVELSQKGFSEEAEALALRIMHRALDLVDGMALRGAQLADAAGPLPACYHAAHAIPFDRDTLALRPGLRNFQAVRAGEALGAPGSPPVPCPLDGLLLFPKYPPRGPDGRYEGPLPAELVRILQPLPGPPADLYGGGPQS